MKQGLLFKDSPEGRFELYCHYDQCQVLFSNVGQLRKHMQEVHDISWCIKELPMRPLRRFDVTQEQLDNIKNKKCWCGKSKDKWDKNKYNKNEYSGYCSKKHYKDWWLRCDNTAFHRHKFMLHASKICEVCGKEPVDTVWKVDLEMDHIIAIVLGGHPWHHDNLQMLCTECHKAKTKSDLGILASWRQMMKYDLGPMLAGKQLGLEAFA